MRIVNKNIVNDAFHPSFHTCHIFDALSNSFYRSEREVELALLTHPVVRERIEALEIELTTFGALS